MASLVATSPAEIRNGSLKGTWRWVRTTLSMGSVVVMGMSSVLDGHDRSSPGPADGPADAGQAGISPYGPGEGRDAGRNVQIVISHSLETRVVASARPFR